MQYNLNKKELLVITINIIVSKKKKKEYHEKNTAVQFKTQKHEQPQSTDVKLGQEK